MSDDNLVATTLLAGNCDEALTGLCDLLAAEGIAVRFDQRQGHDARRRAAFAGQMDIVWVCGLLAAQALGDGRLGGSIRLAPVFTGQRAAVYQSVVIARAGSGLASLADAAGTRFAVNEYESWSGYHAMRRHLEARRRTIDVFADRVVTGSHRGSVSAVRRGAADIAAIDESVWAWLPADEIDGLVVIDRTGPAPAPPVVMRIAGERRHRLEAAMLAVGPGGLAGVDRFVPVTDADYSVLFEEVPHG